jgi:hypothetical protein
MSTSAQLTEHQAQRIRDVQAMIDKASNYSRLVMTLGYGGFFAVWSTSKQYLSAKHVVLSGLFLMISAFLFIAFQVLEAACVSHLNSGLARFTGADETTRAAKAELFDKTQRRTSRILAVAWPPIFYLCVATGFAGVIILMLGFCRALRALW